MMIFCLLDIIKLCITLGGGYCIPCWSHNKCPPGTVKRPFPCPEDHIDTIPREYRQRRPARRFESMCCCVPDKGTGV